jgi:flagellar export protein FliJ
MRRFKFRLDSVLEWRRVQLDLEETKLQRLFEELHQVDVAERQLAADLDEAGRIVTTSASVEASDLAALESYRGWTLRENARLARLRADCQKRIAAQREKVAAVERDLRLIEKLKERRFEEWRIEAGKEQEALSGELFLARWGRK